MRVRLGLYLGIILSVGAYGAEKGGNMGPGAMEMLRSYESFGICPDVKSTFKQRLILKQLCDSIPHGKSNFKHTQDRVVEDFLEDCCVD